MSTAVPQLGPRKRPVQRRSKGTFEAIVDAAAHILEERQFAGYTTNAVARRAGVSIGSLYQYFPGKDAITLELVDRQFKRLTEDVAQACKSDDWRTAISSMIRAAVRHQLQRPRLARLLDIEEGRLASDAVASAAIDKILQGIIKVIESVPGMPLDQLDSCATDILTITRALADASAIGGETNQASLERRLAVAVFGYILQSTKDSTELDQR